MEVLEQFTRILEGSLFQIILMFWLREAYQYFAGKEILYFDDMLELLPIGKI